MLRKIAFSLSLVGHPVFLFFLTFTYFWLEDYSFFYVHPQSIAYFFLLIFLTTIVLPVIFAFLVNQDLLMKERSRRFFPLIGTALFYLATWFVLKMTPFPDFLSRFLLGLAIGMAVLFTLNFYWKISIHATGFGGLIGLFTFLQWFKAQSILLPLATVIILSGLIGSARLYLNSHTNAELYAGYGIGFIVMLAVFLFK